MYIEKLGHLIKHIWSFWQFIHTQALRNVLRTFLLLWPANTETNVFINVDASLLICLPSNNHQYNINTNSMPGLGLNNSTPHTYIYKYSVMAKYNIKVHNILNTYTCRSEYIAYTFVQIEYLKLLRNLHYSCYLFKLHNKLRMHVRINNHTFIQLVRQWYSEF